MGCDAAKKVSEISFVLNVCYQISYLDGVLACGCASGVTVYSPKSFNY